MSEIHAYFDGGPYDGQHRVTNGMRRFEVYERPPLKLKDLLACGIEPPQVFNIEVRKGRYELEHTQHGPVYFWKGWY